MGKVLEGILNLILNCYYDFLDWTFLPPSYHRLTAVVLLSLMPINVSVLSLKPTTWWLTTLPFTTLCLTVCSCCLYFPHIYRELLEPASINRVLIIDLPDPIVQFDKILSPRTDKVSQIHPSYLQQLFLTANRPSERS